MEGREAPRIEFPLKSKHPITGDSGGGRGGGVDENGGDNDDLGGEKVRSRADNGDNEGEKREEMLLLSKGVGGAMESTVEVEGAMEGAVEIGEEKQNASRSEVGPHGEVHSRGFSPPWLVTSRMFCPEATFLFLAGFLALVITSCLFSLPAKN